MREQSKIEQKKKKEKPEHETQPAPNNVALGGSVEWFGFNFLQSAAAVCFVPRVCPCEVRLFVLGLGRRFLPRLGVVPLHATQP